MTHSILIVEDEKPLAKAMELKFSKAGFTVQAVFNGDEAIAEVQKTHYTVMLLDILMPGTDGFGVLQYMKDNNLKPQHVVITSNLSQTEDIEKAKSLGATDFMVKSNSSLTDIVERVKKLIGA